VVTSGNGPRLPAVACLGALLTGFPGCAPGPISHPGASPAPMNRPVAIGSDSSSGAIESERRTLQGTWDLAGLELAPPGGAARVPVQASGTLTYDEFGNLTIDAHTTDPATPVAFREVTMLSFKGRAVIDATRKELKLMDVTGNANPDEVLSPERRRRYELDADTLRLSSFDDHGQVTAIATWRRRP
jgi:hypothetical protein